MLVKTSLTYDLRDGCSPKGESKYPRELQRKYYLDHPMAFSQFVRLWILVQVVDAPKGLSGENPNRGFSLSLTLGTVWVFNAQIVPRRTSLEKLAGCNPRVSTAKSLTACRVFKSLFIIAGVHLVIILTLKAKIKWSLPLFCSFFETINRSTFLWF